ncbi:MAG TPA: hypothetical protein VH720_11685 [Candidatus Limnocylindrales bacterium]
MTGRIDVVGLDHVQLAMPPGGERDARRFYADLLGADLAAARTALAGSGARAQDDGAVRRG